MNNSTRDDGFLDFLDELCTETQKSSDLWLRVDRRKLVECLESHPEMQELFKRALARIFNVLSRREDYVGYPRICQVAEAQANAILELARKSKFLEAAVKESGVAALLPQPEPEH